MFYPYEIDKGDIIDLNQVCRAYMCAGQQTDLTAPYDFVIVMYYGDPVVIGNLTKAEAKMRYNTFKVAWIKASEELKSRATSFCN